MVPASAKPVVRTVASTGSTNLDLLVEARRGASEGSWLRAEQQTGGRGRAQRRWSSPPGNVYASTIVRLLPRDPVAAGLALVAGVALQEVAAAYAGNAEPRLKWPNDLLVGPAKLAGILLEREGDVVVIGFGVNLATAPALPDRPAIALSALGAAVPDACSFVLELGAAVARWLGEWRGRGLEPVRRRWLERAHPIGAAIGTTTHDGRVEGLFDGLDTDGALRLRRPDGSLEIILAGDVHLL